MKKLIVAILAGMALSVVAFAEDAATPPAGHDAAAPAAHEGAAPADAHADKAEKKGKKGKKKHEKHEKAAEEHKAE